MYKFILIYIVLFFSVKVNCAQQDSLTKTDNIPALSSLIDTAILHSPILKQQESRIHIRNIEYKQSKTLWLDKIYVYSDVKYGSVDNVLVTNDGIVDNTSVSTRYAAGAALKFSIFDFIDNKRQTVIASEKMNIDKERYNELINVIRQSVISQYNELILSMRLLEIQVDVHETQQIQLNIAEKQFLESIISVSEYSKIVEIAAKASVSNELAKSKYIQAYMMLEETVGKKINQF